MLIVVSPAKTLDYDSALPKLSVTQPRMLAQSAELIERARELAPADIASLMKVSDKIAHLNADRFAQWSQPFTEDNARAAAFAFKGDVYTGLDFASFTAPERKAAQQRFRMLSGLYGVLRPLDLMQPYRLEMGTKLDNPKGKDLYAFWGDSITNLLNADMAELKTDILVNLASNEYFKSVKKKQVAGRIVEPVFQDQKNGTYKVISFFAKKARGLMAAWIIQNKIKTPEALLAFDVAGYRYDEAASTVDKPVFRRAEQAA